jgi:hypothetical protein
MKPIYKTLVTSAGAGLIALGVYQFKDCNSLRENPHRTHQVSHILDLQKSMETINSEAKDIYNSRPESAHIWSSDDKTRELIDKLNEPTNIKLKTLADLYTLYDQEIDKLTATNKTWESYCQWNRETKAKNKSNIIDGLIASLSGIGLLALSRKN